MVLDDQPFDQRLHNVASLDQPVRRAIYDLLAERRDWLSRDDVAEELGLARSVAAFHLERLAEARLVDVQQVRLSGRTGPGAGRPAKLYRRSEAEVRVSVPERRYELAALVLARAVDDAINSGRSVADALLIAARDVGSELGARLASKERRTSVGSPAGHVVETLRAYGYAPHEVGGEIVLQNCPFHLLAEEHRQLVCGMNVELLAAVLDRAGHSRLEARLDPQPGYCCVRLGRRRSG